MRIGISGTPGTGKTSISKGLSAILKIPHVDVSKSAIEMDWTTEYDNAKETSVIDLDRARQELSGMDDVIIDVHYAELFDCDLIFIIRCSPDELYRRLSARGYGREKVRENVLSEILDTCLINAIETMGSGRVFEIVSGDMEENIDLIVDIVRNGGQGREVGSRSSVHYLTPENLELLDRI